MTKILLATALTVSAIAAPSSFVGIVDPCAAEHNIQIGPENAAYGSSYAATGRMYAYNWSNSGCGGPTVETVLMRLSPDAKNWFEVGYKKCTSCGDKPSGSVTYVWGETGIAGTYSFATGVALGFGNNTPRFKIANVNGSNDWIGYYDASGGTNYTQFYRSNSLSRAYGDALGEVGGYGLATDDFTTHQWDLKWRDVNGTYHDWAWRQCDNDTLNTPAAAFSIDLENGITSTNEWAAVSGVGDCSTFSDPTH